MSGLIGKVDHFIRDIMLKKLNDKNSNFIASVIKFAIVGIINNAIYYIVYLIVDLCGIHYMLSNIIAFTVSVFNAYYWNNRFVFASKDKRPFLKTFLKTYISYASTGIVLSNLLLYVWVEVLFVPQLVAPLINLFITVPINFVVNKLWAFK